MVEGPDHHLPPALSRGDNFQNINSHIMVMELRMIREGSRLLLSKVQGRYGRLCQIHPLCKTKAPVSDNVESFTIGVDQSDSGH